MIKETTPRDLGYIAGNLNKMDRAECVAQVGEAGLRDTILAHAGSMGWIAWHNDKPAAAFGVAPMIAGTWVAWMFGTKDSWRVVPEITRMIPAIEDKMRSLGGRRAEARSIITHHRAHSWLSRGVGMERAAEMPGYGVEGETFVLFQKEL